MKKIDKKTYVCALLKANVVNGNGRVYSPETLESIKKQFGELNHPMYGELGYPDSYITTLSNASHKVNKLFTSVDKIPRKKKKKLKKAGLYKRIKNSEPILWGEIKVFKKSTEKIISGLVARPRGTGVIESDGQVKDYKIFSFDLIPREDDSFKNIL